MRIFGIAIWAACALCPAQQREVGISAASALWNGVTLAAPSGNATAGFSAGPAVGVALGQDLYPRLGGEIRYLFSSSRLNLASGPEKAAFAARAHALHYDLLWHARRREASWRPFVATGGGVKIYQGTGAEQAWRPLTGFAYLTKTIEWKPMLSVGSGVKARLGRRILLRAEFRDYITAFPSHVIAPAPGVKSSGLVHQFVPMAGIGYLF